MDNPAISQKEPHTIDQQVHDACILIVDDSVLSRELIGFHLRESGFANIEMAEDGQDAIDKLANITPDLVILDIVMPNMDGFEFCRQIRKTEKWQNLPILVQTALENDEERLRIFEVGANDLVSKPVNARELVSRVRVHIQNRQMMSAQQKLVHQMHQELDAARAIQESLLPNREEMEQVGKNTGIMIRSHYETSSQLGGDIWGLRQLSDHEIFIYIADFAGHGVVPAMSTFRLHTLLANEDRALRYPDACLQNLNVQLNRVLRIGQFATMLAGVIDTKKQTFRYAAAANPPILICRSNGDLALGDTKGVPIGITKDSTYQLWEIAYNPGDHILLYSDCLIEQKNREGQPLGVPGLCHLVRETQKNFPPERLMKGCLQKFVSQGTRPFGDDLTLAHFYWKP